MSSLIVTLIYTLIITISAINFSLKPYDSRCMIAAVGDPD